MRKRYPPHNSAAAEINNFPSGKNSISIPIKYRFLSGPLSCAARNILTSACHSNKIDLLYVFSSFFCLPRHPPKQKFLCAYLLSKFPPAGNIFPWSPSRAKRPTSTHWQRRDVIFIWKVKNEFLHVRVS